MTQFRLLYRSLALFALLLTLTCQLDASTGSEKSDWLSNFSSAKLGKIGISVVSTRIADAAAESLFCVEIRKADSLNKPIAECLQDFTRASYGEAQKKFGRGVKAFLIIVSTQDRDSNINTCIARFPDSVKLREDWLSEQVGSGGVVTSIPSKGKKAFTAKIKSKSVLTEALVKEIGSSFSSFWPGRAELTFVSANGVSRTVYCSYP